MVRAGTLGRLMRSTLAPVEGNKVKLSVEVPADEFEKAVDAAFRRIAREVKIPGFRPGKAPRRLLEARLGTDVARSDALQHALPEYYSEAIQEHEIDVIAPPEIDITAGEESGDVAFDAVVEVRPQINLGGYNSLRITLDNPEPSEEEVAERIDHLRGNFAKLETVERPAIDGDNLSIDIAGTQAGESQPGLTTDDYLYEVGSGTVVPELDENLRGAKPGDILQFTAAHPDPDEEPVDFRILVKEVKAKVLPDPDDAWATEASEFETVDELRADLTKRLGLVKKVQGQMALQQKTAEALADLVSEDVPEALVNTEMQHRLEQFAARLQAQGMGIEEWFEAAGQTQEAFLEELRDTAAQGVKVDLALRALAEAESIEVDDDDLNAEFASVASRVGQKPSQLRKDFERNHQMPLVRSDVRKRKALEWLIEHVEIVDEQGNPIDRSSFEVDDEVDHGRSADEDPAPSDETVAEPHPTSQADTAAADAESTEETE